MFSRCYCVKLNPLRYQHVSLFFPLLYFISRISMIRQASTEQLDSLPILQQSVITEHKFSFQTRSTKTIMMIISLKEWKKKKSFHLFTFLYPLYCNFTLFGFFGEARRRVIFRALPPSFRRYGGEMLYLVCQFLGIFGEQQKTQSDISRPCYTLRNTIL